MGIKVHSSSDKYVKDVLNSSANSIHNRVINALSLLGRKCVHGAVNRPQEESFIDRTGNLRSSIGFIVGYNGLEISHGGFVGLGNEGKEVGLAVARDLLAKKKGYVLIVVAGMSYAVIVEGLEGKSVLSSAELFAEKEIAIIFNRIQK